MSEHTPGPWTYTGEEDNDFVIWAGDSFIANVGDSAFVPMGQEGIIAFDVQTRDNAKLIASAPDLLAERDRLQAENRRLNEALDGLEAKWLNERAIDYNKDLPREQAVVWEAALRVCAIELRGVLREARAAIQSGTGEAES